MKTLTIITALVAIAALSYADGVKSRHKDSVCEYNWKKLDQHLDIVKNKLSVSSRDKQQLAYYADNLLTKCSSELSEDDKEALEGLIANSSN